MSTEQGTEVSEGKGGEKKSRGVKRKKTTALKDPNAPKRPATAYQLFYTEMWQKLRSEQTEMGFADITRQLASQWATMTTEEKQPYFESSDKAKERYMQEVLAYQQTETYKQFMKAKKEAASKFEDTGKKTKTEPQAKAAAVQEGSSTSTSHRAPPLSTRQDFVSGTDIPIFTEEFLKHNREMESELRKVRHSNIDLEEENALLSRHVENMKKSISRLHSDIEQQQTKNTLLKDHLQSLRETLTTAFRDTPLPGTQELPSEATIDGYLANLQVAIAGEPEKHRELVAMAKEVVRGLEQRGEGKEVEETMEQEDKS